MRFPIVQEPHFSLESVLWRYIFLIRLFWRYSAPIPACLRFKRIWNSLWPLATIWCLSPRMCGIVGFEAAWNFLCCLRANAPVSTLVLLAVWRRNNCVTHLNIILYINSGLLGEVGMLGWFFLIVKLSEKIFEKYGTYEISKGGGKKNRKNQGDFVFQSVIAKYA